MRTTLLLPLLAAAMLAGGCASTVRVRTEPGKAMIYYRGEGRPTFRWKPAPTTSPASFKVYYSAISAYAVWPDGSQSRKTEVVLSNWGDPEPLVLRPDPSLPRIGAATAPASGPGARPSGYRSAPAFDKRSVQKGDALAELPPPKLELPPPSED